MALPGGFVDANQKETAFMAAKRELKEETNVEGLHVQHFAFMMRSIEIHVVG